MKMEKVRGTELARKSSFYKKFKYLLCLFVSVFILFNLSSCSVAMSRTINFPQNKTRHVKESVSIGAYKINTKEQVIRHGSNVYKYTWDPNNDNDRIIFKITYPNDSTYGGFIDGGGTAFGWSDDYSSTRYADGGELVGILKQVYITAPKNVSLSIQKIIFGVIFIGLGILQILKPELGWRSRRFFTSWQYRDENIEPSDTFLLLTQIGGGIVVIIGIVIIFMPI